MTHQDIAIGALTAWRENRGGGAPGMQSVLNVLQNRATHLGTSVYAEAVRKWQFSSMTAPGDPNLILFPADADPQWAMALVLAGQMSDGVLADITGGATSYYADSMTTPPGWAAAMTPTVEIAGQKFFR
jgi:N-acetylmuramoyl-L-alanine amidase